VRDKPACAAFPRSSVTNNPTSVTNETANETRSQRGKSAFDGDEDASQALEGSFVHYEATYALAKLAFVLTGRLSERHKSRLVAP